MKLFWFILIFSISVVHAENQLDYYDELLDYVQESPDQGEAATCLFMANTGAMELLANKKAGIKNPVPFGKYDLAESHSMWTKSTGQEKSFFDTPVNRFRGQGIHISDWPFEAWSDGRINYSVWDRHPKMDTLPRIDLPEIETIKLFQFGNKWTTGVLNKSHVQAIKDALVKYQSPILVNYNDEGFWHVILIVGFDDRLPGTCYDTNPSECSGMGSFYIRDSFGVKAELRDYDWFRVKGNAAFVVKLK